eukprot:2876657-Prymnesium_polylepis.1
MYIHWRRSCVVGPPAALAGRIAEICWYWILYPLWRYFGWQPGGGKAYARASQGLSERLQRGETVPIVGITVGSHNASACLVEISLARGIVWVSNNEEERFSGVKHDWHFPVQSVEAVREQLRSRDWSGHDVPCFVSGWDFVRFSAFWMKEQVGNLPFNWRLWGPPDKDLTEFVDLAAIRSAASRLACMLPGAPREILGSRHHDNHAYMSYGLSPFYAQRHERGFSALVLVVDGMGDDCTTSFYCTDPSDPQRLLLLDHNDTGARNAVSSSRPSSAARDPRHAPSVCPACLPTSRSGHPAPLRFAVFDSIGMLYQVISSSQGGWQPL